MINYDIKDNEIIVKLDGRIDSSNSAQVQDEIDKILETAGADKLILDAENLEYISSAGLRVVLRLRKSYPELKVINTSSEVYDIFDMTGFTEMMTIEKGYRKISVEGCEVIGKGSNGEVYRIDPDTIVKVYFNADALPDIHRERELARKAFVLGIPTAIPYDVVKVGDSYGSVFELLNAESFTKILVREPERFEEVVSMYVELLKKIHSTEVEPDVMPSEKDVVIGWVKDVKEYLPQDKWEKLLSLVENVPENHHMIHGDYHTKNVMLQNGEYLLIDMDTLCWGDPVFEFASVYNAYKGFYAGRPAITGLSFIGIPYEMGERVFKRTLELYFETNDEQALKTIEKKAELIGLTRILRRTMRREDLNDKIVSDAVEHYKKRICELVDKIDDLKL